MRQTRTVRNWVAGISAVAVVALQLGVLTGSANAATFTVTKTADTADGTCAADCSLREAIIAANAASGPDTISVPAGTYLLDLTGANEDAAATGDLDITDDLTITGAGAATTIVDGNETDRVFDLVGAGLTVDISALTVQHGVLTGSANVADDGAGIRIANTGTGLTLTNSVVRDNNTDTGAAGGGVFMVGDDTLTLNGTQIGAYGHGNSANRGAGIKGNGSDNVINVSNGSGISYNEAMSSGGGIFLLGQSHNVTVDASAISHNSASTGDGGGIYLHHGSANSTFIVRNGSKINENFAGFRGGGIRSLNDQSFTLQITDSEVLANRANFGGGLYVEDVDSDITLDNARVAFNRVTADCGNGGGIYSDATGPELEGDEPPPTFGLSVLNGSSVDHNYANCAGGGIFNADGTVRVRLSTVGHNIAGNEGGGFYNSANGVAQLWDTTIELNATSQDEGGGIYNDGVLDVTGPSVIVGNTAADGHGGGIFNGGDESGPPQLFIGPVAGSEDPAAPVLIGNTADGSGGGIYNAQGSLLFTSGVAILGNTTVDDHELEGRGGGGGVYNAGDFDSFETVIGFNVAGANRGGGLWNDAPGETNATRNIFVGNVATGRGGGIYNGSAPDGGGVGVALNCSAVALNSSQLDGGGIANAGDLAMSQCQQPSVARKHLRSQTRVEMRLAQHVMQAEEVDVLPFPPIDEDLFGSSLVAENTTGVSGGGIWNQNSMTVDDTTIAANTAPVGTGGGIFNTSTRGAEGMDIRTSTLSDNFAKFAGGGLYNGFRGSVLMVNDTISGNFTNGTGGGIDDESGVEATTRLIHVTVVNNSAPAGNGGGLDASLDEPGDIEVASSIVALNLGGDCSSPAGITSEDYNYSSDASCGFTMSNDQPDAGDPLLGPLDDNGGPTDTHLPASDSPVVDAAETGTPDCQAGGETVERDQRGEIRPESFFGEEERCDIGSVELEFSDAPPPDDGGGTFNSFAAQTGPTYAVNTTDDHIDGGGCEDSSAETDCTLREAVIAANADGVDSTIDVPAGRYVLTLEGAGEDAALTGDLDVTDDVTITGEIDDDGLVVTTVDGDQLDRVFHVNPGGGSPPPVVHLNDLVIQNGVQTTGGGIRSNGDLRLDNTVVVFNRAACEGGGIYSENALTITNGAVVKNGVRGSECDNAGGGIYSTGPLGKVSLSNSAVDLNYAPFEGAGIYSDALGASPALDVDESDVSLNVLTRQVLETCEGGCEGGGAGIYNETTAELTNTDVIGNVTLGGVGGGIYNGGEVMGASLLMPEGDLVASNVAGSVGGGLYTSETTSADIGGATFAGNTATGGGAIYNAGDLLESADTTYLMNTALGRGGGGLWNVRGRATLEGDDVLFNRTTHSVVNNDLNNDVTLGGGGIQNDSNGIEVVEVPEEEHSGVVFTDGTIIGNTAPAALGGGVDNRGTIYVDGSLLAGNSASASDRAGGGAINCFVMFVDDTTVDGNLAGDGDAGGLLNMEVCQINRTLHITNSTVSGNASADDGGGVQNDIGTTDVLNSTFSGNFAATGTGGGLDEVSPDTTHLHNATIAFNSALLGGGVSKDGGGDVDALNTLVGLNFGGDCDVLLTSLGHNLDSDSSCFNGPTDVTHPATFLDPLLGPLANNGGPTDTHALLDGSPAIDKTPDDEECPETDQRHVTRPQGELCDIGAYEREAAEPSPSPSPSASPSPSPSPSQTQPPSGGGGGGPTSTDLAVTKTASPEPVASGGTITYTITVKNNGPITATGVNTVDNLPGGVTFVSSSASQGSCSGTATVTCDLGTLPNGATATVTIVVTVTANSGSVTNSVAVQGTQSDPNPDNNRAEAVSRIIGTSPSPSPTTTPPGAKCPGFEDDPRNQIVGTDADEELVGTAGPDIICGLGGNDTLRGLGDDDLLIGDSGPVNHRPRIFAAAATGNKDVLRGGFGKDTLFGNEGKDKLRGGAGDDELNGQLGRDNLGGNNDADTLRGGKGRDRGRGGPGPDILLGGRGRDHMAGNADADVVKGGRGNDVLFGKRGDDQVIGGKGTDTENGGIGKDSCLESDDAQTHCES